MPINTPHPNCGIYEIHCLANGRLYVGSSKNLSKRLSAHRCHLRQGKHHNRHLQRAWDLYGATAFTFQVLSHCSPSERLRMEQERFARYDWVRLFNQARDASSGGSAPGWKHTEEAKRKIGEANRGRVSWNAGGVNTWGAKAAASRANNYSYEIEAGHLDGTTQRFTHEAEAARHFGYKRKRVSESIRRESRTLTGWAFRKVQKEVCHSHL